MKRLLAIITWLMLAQPAYAGDPITAHIITHHGKTIDLKLELATTNTERMQGLMNRNTLAPYDGMAFFFPASSREKFWMKNTLIPLDIVFVDEAGSIIYITTGQPLSLTPIGPDGLVATVIELNGGGAAKDGIAVGDKVKYDVNKSPKLLAQ